MDISSLVEEIEDLLKQPYQNVAAHHQIFLEIIERDIRNKSVTGEERKKFDELREQLLQHKANSKQPPFPGSSARRL